MSTLWCSSHKIFKNLFCAWECDVKAKCPLKWIEWMFSVLKKIKLKAHFQPWCNARQFLITWNSQITENPSKIVFLKSHPGHIVNCFTVNTFAVRHFTLSLQYFEVCLEESEENFFLSVTLRTLWTESAKRTKVIFFHFLETLEDSKRR